MIQLAFVRQSRGLSDFTWIELHYQICAGITFLFTLWTSVDCRARAKEEWTGVKSCLTQWETVLSLMVKKWPKVSRARDILIKLADVTVEIVEKEMMETFQHKNTGKSPLASGGQYCRSKTLDAWLGKSVDNPVKLDQTPDVEEARIRDNPSVAFDFGPSFPDQILSSGGVLETELTQNHARSFLPAQRSWTESAAASTGFTIGDANGSSLMFGNDLLRTWSLPLEEQQLYPVIGGLEHFCNVGRWPYDDIAGLADMDMLDPMYTDSALNFHGSTNHR
jgi:hypothetical protein